MENPFLLPADCYVRDLNPIRDWAEQTAWYGSKMLGRDYQQCLEHLKAKITSGKLQVKDPDVVFYHRGDNGDRHKQSTTLRRYLNNIVSQGHILAPTGTAYLHPSVKESHVVGFLDENVVLRKNYKKTAAKFEAEGNVAQYLYFHNMQDNTKRDNNAVSGGFVAEGSIIMNKTAHSTLTSVTRSIASLSNSCNERLIEGNRHYYSPEIILGNITSICSRTDYQAVEEAVRTYGLITPTVEQVVACIRRSSDLYFQDTRKIEKIQALVEKMNDLERCAFVYTGDLYHIRVLNDSFMRGFCQRLSARGDTTPHEDVVAKLYKADELVVNYAHQINLSMMRGKGKDYAKMPESELFILYNTVLNIVDTIQFFKPFLKAFFLTRNSPPTMASMPKMLRRAVVLSDTDSTMFSVDSWNQWYFGKIHFSDEAYALAGSIMYMTTQSIAHILAQFSANLNVEKKRLFTLAMKPEYVFPVFAQTSVAKHYYTAMAVKEGQVYDKLKMEIKGVHMKDSTVPKNIIKGAADEMKAIIERIMEGRQLSLYDILNKTMDVENEIESSLKQGETTYLKRLQVKPRSSYKEKTEEEKKFNAKGEEIDHTNHRHYTCWERCFVPHSKNCHSYEAPPYQAVTIPILLTSATTTNQWLSGLENRAFAEAFASWMVDHGIKTLSQLHIPIGHCQNFGIPEELTPILDFKRIILGLTRSYRNVVESHGFYSKPEMMFSEQFSNIRQL